MGREEAEPIHRYADADGDDGGDGVPIGTADGAAAAVDDVELDVVVPPVPVVVEGVAVVAVVVPAVDVIVVVVVDVVV